MLPIDYEVIILIQIAAFYKVHPINKINLFAEQDKHLSKINTMTQIVVQARLLLMEKKAKSSSDHIT